MDWEEAYKTETGHNATYTEEARGNPSRTDTWYYDTYTEWLEDKLTAATQPADPEDKVGICSCETPEIIYSMCSCGKAIV